MTASVFLLCQSIVGPIFCSCFGLLVLLRFRVILQFLFSSSLFSLRWCLALVLPVVGSRLLFGSAQALSHPAEELCDALLPPLALKKENFAEVDYRIL